ncbi:MAG: hypothetical protein HYY17_12745 [Planctomycetes bacterium]|nr:hypothetical protein [Planctomycetota bacterium]
MKSDTRTWDADRRRAPRERVRLRALLGSPRSPKSRCEEAWVEDVGSGGLRIRTVHAMKPGERCILHPEWSSTPATVMVVWVQRAGLVERRSAGASVQTFVAGCVLGPAPAARSRPGLLHLAWNPIWFPRLLLGAVVLAVVALAAHFLVSVVALLM